MQISYSQRTSLHWKLTAAWVPAITSTKLKHGVRDSEQLRCHRAEWKQEATLEQQGEESVLQQWKKMLQRDGNNHACRAKCHGLSWQENPRLGKEWTLKQVSRWAWAWSHHHKGFSWIHFSNGFSWADPVSGQRCRWATLTRALPDLFLHSSQKKKHDLDSLWTDPICGNDMVSLSCSPYSPAACTHSSFMHLSPFSFFPLDSTIIYCTCQAIFSAVSSASLTGRMQTNCVEQTLLCRRKQWSSLQASASPLGTATEKISPRCLPCIYW